jgi:hypothetical protein
MEKLGKPDFVVDKKKKDKSLQKIKITYENV